MNIERLASAVIIVALFGATGCGESASPTQGKPLPSACPCDDPLELLSTEAVRIGSASYLLDSKPAIASAFREDGREKFPLGLDVALAFTGRVAGGRPLLYVAGCKGASSVLRVFTDLDEGEVADDLLGEYALPGTVRVVGLTSEEKGGLYAVDEIGQQILHLVDDDGDGVPDSHRLYAVAPSPSFFGLVDIWTERGGLLLVSEPGCVKMDPVFVVQDADGDGKPERVEETSWSYIYDEGPALSAPPRSTDTQVSVSTAPRTTIELWLTDRTGEKARTDRAIGLVGLATVGETDRVEISLTQRLAVGQFVTAFDATRKKSGPTVRVHPDYPLVESVSPRQISRTTGGSVVVEGTGFSPSLTVELVRGQQVLALDPVDIHATTLRDEIPPLDESWGSGARLRVTSANSPEGLRHLRLRLVAPPK